MLSYSNNAGTNIYMPCYSISMYVGSNTNTPTAYDRTVLVSPIGTSPGTAPNSIIGGTSNPSNGVYRLVITATWSAGIISGTIGEMALYLNTFDTALQTFGWSGPIAPPAGNRLVSRLSVADGDFSAFTINTGNPLAITWTIQLSFA